MRKRLIFLLTLSLFIISCVALPAATALPPATVKPDSASPEPATIAPMEPAKPSTSPAAQHLGRGINFGNTLEAPNEGEWGFKIEEKHIEAIKNAGFDYIRLPIRWNAHAEWAAPYTIDPTFFTRIDEIVGWALKRGLKISINIHHYEEMASDPWANEERFIGLWMQIAEHYQNYPPELVFELMNEPNNQMNAALWNFIQNRALSVVRTSNPTRDVIIGPIMWNSYEWLNTLDLPPNDPHIIATFHYYLPFEFTHQGAEWVEGSDDFLGSQWTGSAAEQANIRAHFDVAQAWAERHNVPILLGEFGAYSKAPQDSRLRWMSFVAREAEARRFAWAYWEFGAGFSLYDLETDQWRSDMLKALIP